MARFTAQPFGPGPILPVSLSLVAPVDRLRFVPRFANRREFAPGAARAKVNNRLSASQRKAGAARHSLSEGIGLGFFMRTQPTLIA